MRARIALLALFGLLASCASLAEPKPSEGMRVPEVPMIKLWVYKF